MCYFGRNGAIHETFQLHRWEIGYKYRCTPPNPSNHESKQKPSRSPFCSFEESPTPTPRRKLKLKLSRTPALSGTRRELWGGIVLWVPYSDIHSHHASENIALWATSYQLAEAYGGQSKSALSACSGVSRFFTKYTQPGSVKAPCRVHPTLCKNLHKWTVLQGQDCSWLGWLP